MLKKTALFWKDGFLKTNWNKLTLKRAQSKIVLSGPIRLKAIYLVFEKKFNTIRVHCNKESSTRLVFQFERLVRHHVLKTLLNPKPDPIAMAFIFFSPIHACSCRAAPYSCQFWGSDKFCWCTGVLSWGLMRPGLDVTCARIKRSSRLTQDCGCPTPVNWDYSAAEALLAISS